MLSTGFMADELRWKVAQQDRELYEVARDAAKVAQREGHAQLQAAAEAGRVVAPAEQERPQQRQQQAAACSVRRWTLKFGDARLEAAYNRKAKTNCDNHDHVASLCRLWACAPPVLMALSGHRLSYGWPLVSASRAGLYMCVMCNLCIAVVCAIVLIVQLSFPAWYRSHRGTTLWWFVSALWIVESGQLFVKADDLRVFMTQILVPTLYMSCTYRLPYIIHLKSRAFGLGCQAVAILGSANCRHAPLLLMTSLFGHSLGVLLVYLLDRRARQGFLRSLPSWLLDDLHGSGSQQPQIFQSYRASFSRQMWQIFYPELFEPSKDPIRRTIREESVAPPGSRRALGGFAGGFGGVSGLKCNTSPSSALMSLSSSSLSAPESESSGDCYAGFQPPGADNVKGPSVRGPLPARGIASSSSSGSSFDIQEEHSVRYRGR